MNTLIRDNQYTLHMNFILNNDRIARLNSKKDIKTFTDRPVAA